MNTHESEERLKAILTEWKISPSRDPQFRSRVWSRIEATTGAASWPRYAQAHRAAIAGSIAVAVVLGALTGRGQAKARDESDRTAIVTNYVDALDARTMTLR